MRMPDGAPDEVQSLLVVYFAVTDCEASAERPGKFAGANDPTGAMSFFDSFPDSAYPGVVRASPPL
ncbi:MAG: hypothetical protein LH630_11270 [Actinomycetia bacterium]|nr:hypothetical protein [Actinomycetes bacterium]